MRKSRATSAGTAGRGFAFGTLVSGSFVGMLLLWVSTPDRPLGNRLMFSLFGGPLLLGFWLWIGAIVGYAVRQNRSAPEAG